VEREKREIEVKMTGKEGGWQEYSIFALRLAKKVEQIKHYAIYLMEQKDTK